MNHIILGLVLIVGGIALMPLALDAMFDTSRPNSYWNTLRTILATLAMGACALMAIIGISNIVWGILS